MTSKDHSKYNFQVSFNKSLPIIHIVESLQSLMCLKSEHKTKMHFQHGFRYFQHRPCNVNWKNIFILSQTFIAISNGHHSNTDIPPSGIAVLGYATFLLTQHLQSLSCHWPCIITIIIIIITRGSKWVTGGLSWKMFPNRFISPGKIGLSPPTHFANCPLSHMEPLLKAAFLLAYIFLIAFLYLVNKKRT